MPLDAQTRAVLDLLAAFPPFVLEPEAMRERERQGIRALGAERELIASVEDRAIPGPGGAIPLRVFRPRTEQRFGEVPPLLMYIHGGGHTIGSLDAFDGVCCQLTRLSGCIVVAVDYRLAPEHRFPAGPEDCYCALEWLAANGAELGGDPARIAVAGDSAGGNLSTVVSMMTRDRSGPRIAFQGLIYPGTNGRSDLPSMHRNGSGYFLTKEMIDWFYSQYLVRPEDEDHPYFAPLKAPDLTGMPPALVITAEYDPLLDEGAAYAERLRAAGITTEYVCLEGTIHACVSLYRLIDKGREALALVADRARRALGEAR